MQLKASSGEKAVVKQVLCLCVSADIEPVLLNTTVLVQLVAL